jgi:ATP-dependent RNA helicase DDX56/DBP9
VLTSATLSEDVTKLKRLVLHNPVTLKLEEPALPEATQLTQYQIRLAPHLKSWTVSKINQKHVIEMKWLRFYGF